MKKALTLFALVMMAAVPSFARYIVVLKDGTSYTAKAKWTVVNGKAIVQLENGQSLTLDPSLIDLAKSEQMTKVGMTGANVIDLNPAATAAQPKASQPSLGSQIKLRQRPDPAQATAPATTSTMPPASSSGTIAPLVLEKFDRAFENVGIFEKKVVSTGARTLRADLTLDTEERVFNAISAASFLMVRNAGVDGAQIDMVEMFMKTTTGGSAGRFQMTRADAEALDKRTISQQDYFVHKVIY